MKLLTTITSISFVLADCLKYHNQDCRDFDLEEIPTDGIEKYITLGMFS
jgi:hypothetical protein